MPRGNGAARRWGLVLVLVAALAAAPAIVAAWPATDADRSAVELRDAALASVDVAFSGDAVATGGLALPETDQLESLADLFSSSTSIRVWWRGPTDSRVDVVTVGGETGYYRASAGLWTWEYEANRATRSYPAALALPAAADLVPATLGRRLLSEADPAELSRIGAQRVGWRDALGVRLVPADAAASVASVDVWVDAASGLPLQVRVFGKGAANPALDTRFLNLDLAAPDAAITSFSPPADANVQYRDDLRLLDTAGRQLPAVAWPATLAGLPRRPLQGAPRAVGVYGRGVTLLAIVPVRGRLAGELRRAAERDPTAVIDELGARLTAGPLTIMLVDSLGRDSYLLTGTVTADALAQAARELPDLGAGVVTAPDVVIATRALTKRFGRLTAVDGIDLTVRAGDVYGFLGANGSGKTTTLRMVLGLVLPTSGEVDLLDERMPRAGRSVLPRVGALIEGPAFYGHLAGRENLALLDASGPGGARRTRRRRIDEVLEQVGLSGVRRRPVRAYSMGMRQRLGLAAALLRRPELLVLDEPTNGLDPQGIAEIRALLLDLNRGGTTVFLSSHLLAEIEQMATRVGVLDRGRLVLQEELAVLTAPTGSTVVTSPQPDRVRATLDGRVSAVDGHRLVVRGADPAEVNARLVAAGVPVTGLALERPTLEQVVLAAASGTPDRVDARVDRP